MAPQTRSKARRTTRSSTRAQVSSLVNVATDTRADSSDSKTNSNNKRTSKPKHNSEPKRATKRARHESDGPEVTPPVKARKRTKTSAKLEVFKNMPVEVFIEIAKYLHPFDLVLLSRVNKFFRELFMGRHASPIWRSALLNVPKLPPCPTSLCEPQYAALLFTKMCSTCGKWAPRNMDPVLLVRLCTKCRDKQAVNTSIVTDSSLVFSSYDLVPGQHGRMRWCLYNDARAVKSKLNELVAAGDTKAKAHWEKERRKEVYQRHKDAQPLELWLKDRDNQREAELDRIKRNRQREIESRLAKLGWEKDLTSRDYWRKKEWKSLLYNTKSLTDRAWEKLLPDLLVHLELNREERLRREMDERTREREPILRAHMGAIQKRLSPFAQAIPEDGSSVANSAGTKRNVDHKERLLAQPFPAPRIFCGWAELKDLIEADTTMQRFKERFDEQKNGMQELITSWTNTIEAHMVTLLPKGTQNPKFGTVPGFTLVVGTGYDTKPISSLPTCTQKLLRADAIFTESRSHSELYYPDDFKEAYFATSDLKYHVEASKVAKALLSALNRPDASYLELKALGRVFHCGRCNSPPEYMSWRNIVWHYLAEAKDWSWRSKSQRAQEAKDFTFAFTHNTDVVNPAKPLVRIVDYSNRDTKEYRCTQWCKVCQSVNISNWCYTDFIVDHLRDVHLIEEPEVGKHY